MSITSKFDPARDGWYFENWGEHPPYCIGSGEFSWDLYRQTYLGINPTHDCVEAPLDCKFYEIFKSCAKQGNCGGMSLLALALFKYGGYMGFCGPARFYTGATSPDRADLHRIINVVQARQFSAPGVENFLDVVNSGNLGNAEAAFNKIKAQLANGDYAVLSIARNLLGENAHTIIPYELDEHPAGFPGGTRAIYVWDPNYPYDSHPDYYTSHCNRVIVRSAFNWEYHQGFYGGAEHNGKHYTSPGWCFAIPMSVVLHKARQPIALDMVLEGLTAVFVSGPGCSVAQIEDETGRRFYKTEADGHILRDEVDTTPIRRMPNIGRWPWYAVDGNSEPPGELYFLRRPVDSPALQVILHGSNYRLIYVQAGNIIEVQGYAPTRARDVVRLAGVSTSQQALSLETDGVARRYDIHQQRLLSKGVGWRSIALQKARVGMGGVHIQTIGNLQAFEISGLERQVNFSVELKQYTGEALTARPLGRHGAAAGRTVRFTPLDWGKLEETEVKKQSFKRSKD